MAYRFTDVAKKVPEELRSKGLDHVLQGGVRYGRERLPVELWPPLCLDPKSEAAERVELFESPAVDVRYEGDFESELPPQLAAYDRRITGPEGAVYRFEAATLVGRHPMVELDGTAFPASWFRVDTPFFVHQNRYLRRNFPLSRVLKSKLSDPTPDRHLDTAFLLLGERGRGFHHWFYETLPKLRWFEAYRARTGDDPVLVVNSPLSGYQRRSLELMGYGDWLEHGNEATFVDDLLLAPHPIRLKGNQLQAVPAQLEWVGDRLLSGVSDADTDFGDRIYVSRADADRRRVDNEDEVLRTLSRWGFEAYEPGRLSLEDQVRLFGGADVIVGPHGMAYTNLIYARDASLVEFFADGGATETYFVGANELGLSYEFLECESVDSGANVRPRDKDLVVDIERLERVVADRV